MNAARAFVSRLLATVRPDAGSGEVDEEVDHHLEMQAQEYERRGMSPEAARAEALRRFGHVESMKNQYRDLRRLPSIDGLLRDVQYSARRLRRSPAFALLAVSTLAIGIGATTAVFSLVNRALLAPLPVARPHELVSLNRTGGGMFPTFSHPNYADLRDRNDVFAGLIAYRIAPISVSASGVNERLWCYMVSGNYFDVLGVAPALGRPITRLDDEERDAHPVTVISYRFWQQRFGGSARAIGQRVMVNGRGYTIVGVAPRGFFGTEVVTAPDFWFPLGMQAALDGGTRLLDDRGVASLFLLGRLASGVGRARASASVNAIAASLAREFPDVNEGKGVALSPPGLLGSAMRGPVIGFTGLLLAVAALVLLLACVNLANLLLARAIDRREEIAIRLSVGAGRATLVRQLLIESLMLSMAAGAAGMALAWWLMRAAAALRLPIDLPLVLDLPLDGRVLAFNVLLSLAAAVLFGLVPALQSTRANLTDVLKDSTSANQTRSVAWRNALIVVQVAVSLVLLTGAGLMWRALAQTQGMALGFSPDGAFEVAFDLRLQGYGPDQGRELQRRLLDAVRAQPGITDAALADILPIDLHFSRTPVYTDEMLAERDVRAPRVYSSLVTPGYFRTMRTALLEGRDFAEHDDEESAPVAIVNRALARRLWPDGEAIGRRLRVGSGTPLPLGELRAGSQRPRNDVEVVGVVQDGKYASFNDDGAQAVFRPFRQSYSGTTSIVARTGGDVAGAIAAVRGVVRSVDPNMPLAAARPLAERLSIPLLPARVAALGLASFGALALVLAAVGLYGIMSYSVSSRTHEIGIRVALGANPRDVMRLILGEGGRLIAIGIVAGVALAAAGTRMMRAILFGVSPTDPATYAAVVAALAGVALLACWIPARRALRADPLEALRAN